jgi:predicted ABC-type transport system involved in lysophospholipase L1 biosynthesis ATPase subunit
MTQNKSAGYGMLAHLGHTGPALDANGQSQRGVLDLLEQVGLGPRIHHRPQELSGGEKPPL